jgi:flagellar hook-basal body complex protein FliE
MAEINLNSLTPKPISVELQKRQKKPQSEEGKAFDFMKSFSKILSDALNKTNELQINSNKLTEKLVAGEVKNIHEVTIAAQKAGIALSLTTAIREQIIRSYRQIMMMGR